MSRKLYGLYENLDVLKLIDRESKYLHNYSNKSMCIKISLFYIYYKEIIDSVWTCLTISFS